MKGRSSRPLGLTMLDVDELLSTLFAVRVKYGFVYIIQAGDENGPIKIGYSAEPAIRINALRKVNGHPLKILGLFPANESDEAALHRAFAHDNLHHEWFVPSKTLLALAACGTKVMPKRMGQDRPARLRIIRDGGRIQVVDRDYETAYYVAATVDEAQKFLKLFDGESVERVVAMGEAAMEEGLEFVHTPM